MLYIKKNSLFETFFENRNSLIIQFNNGDLSKKEFITENFNFITGLNIKPFIKVDSYEKGMFNYQYYNSMAKYYLMLAKELNNDSKHRRYYVNYLNTGNGLYHKKDITTLKILKIFNFEGVSSYFIKTNSKSLDGKLYEIIIKGYDEAIFHSKALWLIDILKKEDVFLSKKKRSIIDSYINNLY